MKSFLLFFLFFTPILLFGQNKNELEKKRNLTLKEITETQNILDKISNTKTETLEKFNLLDRKINLRNKLIENLNFEISDVDSRILELEKTTNNLNRDVVSIKKEYAQMIYLSYLNRGQLNALMFILASKDMNQAYKRFLYLKQYSDYKKKQVLIIKGVQNNLFAQISKLETTKNEKNRLLISKENENENLKSELEERSKSIVLLKRQESELLKKLKEKNKIAEKIKSEIETVIKAELASKNNIKKDNVSKSSFTSDAVLSNNFRDNKGKLPWPTDNGVVSNSFGEHPNPVYKGVKITNYGIDISTSPDSDVRSVFDGVVTVVKFIKGANYFVLIRHGSFISVYLNIIDIKVKIGDKVKTKQTIGKVYTDIDSKSTILHVEIWEDINKLDPEMWLKRI